MFSRTVSLFFWMGLAALAGYWLNSSSGHLLGAFFICFFTVLKDLWKGQKITEWLRHNNVQEPPQMGGIWGDLIDRMRRILNEERKQTQNEAQKLQDFLLAIQASPNGVVLLDPEGRIEWCNQTAAQHLGMDAKRDLMQHVVHLVRDPVFKKYFTSETHEGEAVIDGRSVSLQKAVKLSVQLHNYGENRQLLLTRDVTTVAQAEAMRRDFVANVSHEIRTPLTVMSGFIETLQSLNLNKDERDQYLNLMSAQASRMQDLVNDLLILSQLEGSNLPSINEPISLQGLMAGIESEARGLSATNLQEFEAPQILHFETPESVRLSGANKELHTNFEVAQFTHWAFYNAPQNRIEMHLVSLKQQEVKLKDHLFVLEEGETLHTENSYKYAIDKIQKLAARQGLQPGPVWTDSNQWFGLLWFDIPDFKITSGAKT